MLTTDQLDAIRERCEEDLAHCERLNIGSFIARAREDIPALMDALEELKTYSTPAGVYRLNEELRTDRDRWKARCEAMERAIKSEDDRCYSCTHSCISGSSWQFDEARFAGAGGDPVDCETKELPILRANKY